MKKYILPVVAMILLTVSASYADDLTVSGKVGIGTTTPSQALDVIGNVKADSLCLDGDCQSRWRVYNLTRTLPANVDDYVEIGSFYKDHGGHPINVNVALGGLVTKQYLISTLLTSPGWHEALPIVGSYNRSDDFSLQVDVSGYTTSLRLRRVKGSSADTVYITLEYMGAVSATFTNLTGTGQTTAQAIYDGTPLTQVFGKVGIGMSRPDYELDVNGAARNTSGTWVTSDQKFKKNIKPMDKALDKMLKVAGYSYELKADQYKEKKFPKGEQYGLIAQEIETVIPEMVRTDSKGEKSVSYTMMVPFLLEAIKEQQEMIDKGIKEGEGNAAWETQESGDVTFDSGNLQIGNNESPSDLSVTGRVGLNSAPSDSYQVTLKGTQVSEEGGSEFQRGLQVEVNPDASKWTLTDNHVSGIDANVVADDKLGDEILETQVGINIEYGVGPTASAASVVQNAYGLKIDPAHAAGQVDNSYGLYISAPAEGGTVNNKWAVYQADSNTKNYFAGNVGIGVEEPSYKLDVDGDINANGLIFSSGTPITSDLRLKEAIEPLDGAVQKIVKLRGVNYNWKEGVGGVESKRQIGFIAQEVEKVYPELVSTGKDGHKAVDYARLMPVVVEAIKSLKAENDALKAENAAMGERLSEMEMMKLRMAEIEATLAKAGSMATIQGKVDEK